MRVAAPVARRRYDWRACAISVVAGLAVATPAGLAVTAYFDSVMLLTAVISVVGTSVSHGVYARVAKKDARPVEDETCPL